MKKQLLFISMLSIYVCNANAQQCLSSGFCSNFTNQYPAATFSTTSSAWTTVSAYMNAGNWTLFNVTSGNTYEWTYCETYGGTSTAWHPQLTLINNSTNANLCFSDNVCGTNGTAPYISWTATYTGVVKLLTSQANCASNTGAPYTTLVWRQANGVQNTAVLGIDVSHYDGSINWTQVKAVPKVFAWCKATEGLSNTDATFTTNMTNGTNAGVIMGGYHFAHPETNSASAEASYFVGVAGSYIHSCALPPVLDLEDPSGGPSLTSSMTSSALTTWVQAWMSAVQTQTGITPVLYTNGSIATYLGSSVKSAYKLWMADPDGSSTAPPANIGGWPTWTFKQYSFTGTVSGISSQVDLNVFNGNITAFNTLIGCGASVPPAANFTASAVSVCAGQAVGLTDNSTNTPTSWSWTMTGGSPAASSLQSPSVTYSTAGTYTVTLVASNSFGASSPISHTITVNAIPSVPTINVSGSTLTSSASAGNQWFFNGTAIIGAVNQTYTASSSGSYTVTVTNSFGCSSTSAASIYSNNSPPAASFTASSANCAGQTITLTDNSTNTPTSWSWTMTGGNPASSNLQSPSVTYNTPGTYTVTLIATNTSGASSPVSQTITINASPAIPIINISGSTFTSSAANGNQWYLNGSAISGATNQTYTASVNGSYTVVVTNSFGCTSTTIDTTYTNGNAPIANFTAAAADCAGEAITLSDNSTNTPTSWSWTIANGTPASSALQNPSVTYSTPGTYTVTLVASNSSGASFPVSQTITVNAGPPVPTVTLTGITLASSSFIGNQWYFNGVLISGAVNQSCTAAANGLYTVTVTNSYGCSSTSAALNYATGIGSMEDNTLFTVFPNPSNGIVNINFTGRSEHLIIEVINNLGQLVYTEKINDCQNNCSSIIDMSSFKEGIYLFKIYANETIHIKRILLVK